MMICQWLKHWTPTGNTLGYSGSRKDKATRPKVLPAVKPTKCRPSDVATAALGTKGEEGTHLIRQASMSEAMIGTSMIQVYGMSNQPFQQPFALCIYMKLDHVRTITAAHCKLTPSDCVEYLERRLFVEHGHSDPVVEVQTLDKRPEYVGSNGVVLKYVHRLAQPTLPQRMAGRIATKLQALPDVGSQIIDGLATGNLSRENLAAETSALSTQQWILRRDSWERDFA
ncbi:hypothetical protein LSAT2_000889 [Lamellibrachia satsuma]|nr:hypothetical protein LSAT2_000889 [Lamellibrachia satsuma]